MSMVPGKLYSFSVAHLAWHLIAGIIKLPSFQSFSLFLFLFFFSLFFFFFLLLSFILFVDERGIIYIMITQLSYPQRCSLAALEELQRIVRSSSY